MTSQNTHQKVAGALKSARQKSDFANQKLRQKAARTAGRPLKLGGSGRATRGAGSYAKVGRAVAVLMQIHAGGKTGDKYSENGAGAQFIDSNMLGQNSQERGAEWLLDELKHPRVRAKDVAIHASFSRPAGHDLNPDQWRQFVQKFLQKVGADGNFTATRHAPPATENDHIHLVFSRSRRDGRLVSMSNSRWKWRSVTREVERELGLTLPDQPAEMSASAPPSDRVVSAQRRAVRRDTPDPHINPNLVAHALAQASTPEDFQAALTRLEIDIKPAVKNGKTTGILFKKRAAQEWLAGSSISREFSLPKIQAQIEMNRQKLEHQQAGARMAQQRQAAAAIQAQQQHQQPRHRGG